MKYLTSVLFWFQGYYSQFKVLVIWLRFLLLLLNVYIVFINLVLVILVILQLMKIINVALSTIQVMNFWLF